jgi:hypothetical protein
LTGCGVHLPFTNVFSTARGNPNRRRKPQVVERRKLQHSPGLSFFNGAYLRRRPCGAASRRGSSRCRESALDRLVLYSLQTGARCLVPVENPQLSSESLRVVAAGGGSVMSFQRQGATRTVEEGLRKWSGASCEAERGFHSLTGDLLAAKSVPEPPTGGRSAGSGAAAVVQDICAPVHRSTGIRALGIAKLLHNDCRKVYSASMTESGWMSIRAPVSFAARRAFWPSLPIASES